MENARAENGYFVLSLTPKLNCSSILFAISLELLFEIILGSKDTKCICINRANSISEKTVDYLRNLNYRTLWNIVTILLDLTPYVIA